MQICELADHPFFMGCQYHPELTSRLEKPAELFFHLIKTAFEIKSAKQAAATAAAALVAGESAKV